MSIPVVGAYIFENYGSELRCFHSQSILESGYDYIL